LERRIGTAVTSDARTSVATVGRSGYYT
jgi:hypothetical protein